MESVCKANCTQFSKSSTNRWQIVLRQTFSGKRMYNEKRIIRQSETARFILAILERFVVPQILMLWKHFENILCRLGWSVKNSEDVFSPVAETSMPACLHACRSRRLKHSIFYRCRNALFQRQICALLLGCYTSSWIHANYTLYKKLILG